MTAATMMYREMDMDFWLEAGAEMRNFGDVGPQLQPAVAILSPRSRR